MVGELFAVDTETEIGLVYGRPKRTETKSREDQE